MTEVAVFESRVSKLEHDNRRLKRVIGALVRDAISNAPRFKGFRSPGGDRVPSGKRRTCWPASSRAAALARP